MFGFLVLLSVYKIKEKIIIVYCLIVNYYCLPLSAITCTGSVLSSCPECVISVPMGFPLITSIMVSPCLWPLVIITAVCPSNTALSADCNYSNSQCNNIYAIVVYIPYSPYLLFRYLIYSRI